MVADVLLQAGRMAERISRTTTYLAAGTRRLEEMQADHRRAWDRFYAKHHRQDTRLLPWEEACLARFVTPGTEVLIVGCGSGRDLLALVERGCRVSGIDPSGEGIAITERLVRGRSRPAKLIHGFFEDTPIADVFDVVIFSYYCYAAIPMASRRVAALKKAAALVNPGGHVIVSHASGVQPPRIMLVRLGRIAGALAGSNWRLEQGDFVSDNRTGGSSLSFTHAFADGELEREAASANLRMVYRHVDEDHTVVVVLTRA